MAKPPRHIQGGRCDPRKLPKGPNGRCLCRQCGTEVNPPRRTFCSQACVQLWTIRTGSGVVRFIRKRDKGICALCGLDCEALKRQLGKILKALAPEPRLRPAPDDYFDEYTMTTAWHERVAAHEARRKAARAAMKAAAAEFKARHGIPQHRSRFWDIDHIVPVAEGGGDAGPEGLRTLCLACHKQATARLLARLAAQRTKASAPTQKG